MTLRNCRRFGAPVLLLCALLVPLLRPSADAARAVDDARPVVESTAQPTLPQPSAVQSTVARSTVTRPTATPDWSGLVVAVDPASAAPPAPPLSLPDDQVELVETATAVPTAPPTPTAQPTSTATALATPTAQPTSLPTSAPIPSTLSATATAVPAVPTPAPVTATAAAVPVVPTLVPAVQAVPAPPAAAPPAVVPTPLVASANASAPATGSSLDARGRRALATLGYDINSIGYTISFHPHTGSHRGLTFTQRRHIEIYIKPSTSDYELAYIIGHEVGHAVDHIRNTGADRARWIEARGIAPRTPWWPTAILSDFATPAGDFAECFASWRLGSASHSSWGGCGSMNSLMAELATS